jgi:hypothetical protein
MTSGVYQRSKSEIERIKKLRKGKVSWNKGLTKQTSDILFKVAKKISDKRISRKEPKRTLKWKRNISRAMKGRIPRPIFISDLSVLKGERTFKGGSGYVFIKFGRKYRAEHRVIMENLLGRSLTIEERVHHKDGDKTNNIPENLYLFSSNSNHIKYEQKTGFLAKQLLAGKISLEDFIQSLKLE